MKAARRTEHVAVLYLTSSRTAGVADEAVRDLDLLKTRGATVVPVHFLVPALHPPSSHTLMRVLASLQFNENQLKMRPKLVLEGLSSSGSILKRPKSDDVIQALGCV